MQLIDGHVEERLNARAAGNIWSTYVEASSIWAKAHVQTMTDREPCRGNLPSNNISCDIELEQNAAISIDKPVIF